MNHFLQSAAWERFQQSLGRQTYRAEGDGWHYLAILEPASFGSSRLYCPYGPTVASEAALDEATTSLKTLGHKLGVTYLRLQPVGVDAQSLHHFSPVDYSQPTHTWLIDLGPNEEAIIQSMKPNTRNIYRNYRKKGLAHEISYRPEDISRLTSLLHEVADHNHISIHTDAYFELQAKTFLPSGDAALHFITKDGQTIAAALVYLDDTTSYYAHAAASHEHRKLSASTALLAEIIVAAKHQGKQYCDLYGVTTSTDPDHRWAGFTRFKQSFGGHLFTYNQTYEYPLRPWRYWGLTTARAIQKRFR